MATCRACRGAVVRLSWLHCSLRALALRPWALGRWPLARAEAALRLAACGCAWLATRPDRGGVGRAGRMW
eukprot:1756249-Alexandrium_andersonii.AAC.1